MINYTEKYFDLDIIKLSDIKLHEATESNRLRNIYNRISKSKYLINPVIVGKHNNDIILLDGANRYGSIKEIGGKMILAQVLDYKDRSLRLEKWNHLIYGFDIGKLKKYCDDNGLSYVRSDYKKGSQAINKKFNLLLAVDTDRDDGILITLPETLKGMLDAIDKITKTYFGQYQFDRSECDINFSELCRYSRKKGTLIIFPTFTKNHIVSIANQNLRLPAGISRHRINNRVLHVRYEIKKLMNDKNIPEKKKDLRDLLMSKIDKNKVRQYQESVIVFDE